MTAETRQVIEAAMRLPREQREFVIEVLSSALEDEDEGESPEEIEAAWIEETRRRVEEVRSGAVMPVPWAEAKARLLKTR